LLLLLLVQLLQLLKSLLLARDAPDKRQDSLLWLH